MNKIKLTIEVPPTNLFLGLRSFSYFCQQLDCLYLWQKFRNKYKKFKNFKCHYCGIKRNLELHEFIDVDDEEFKVKFLKPHFLCHACHSVKQLHFPVIWNGVAAKQFLKVNKCNERTLKNYLRYIDKLKEKRGKKDYKIEFDEIYKPLITNILDYLQGRYIKVHHWYIEHFKNTLNALKKAVNRKEFNCFIIVDRTQEFFYKILKKNEAIQFTGR